MKLARSVFLTSLLTFVTVVIYPKPFWRWESILLASNTYSVKKTMRLIPFSGSAYVLAPLKDFVQFGRVLPGTFSPSAIAFILPQLLIAPLAIVTYLNRKGENSLLHKSLTNPQIFKVILLLIIWVSYLTLALTLHYLYGRFIQPDIQILQGAQ